MALPVRDEVHRFVDTLPEQELEAFWSLLHKIRQSMLVKAKTALIEGRIAPDEAAALAAAVRSLESGSWPLVDERAEIHRLVDALTAQDLPVVHRLLQALTSADTTAPIPSAAEPETEEGQTADAPAPASARPKVASAETLFADILPPDENPDMIIEAVHRWRHEGRDA